MGQIDLHGTTWLFSGWPRPDDSASTIASLPNVVILVEGTAACLLGWRSISLKEREELRFAPNKLIR